MDKNTELDKKSQQPPVMSKYIIEKSFFVVIMFYLNLNMFILLMKTLVSFLILQIKVQLWQKSFNTHTHTFTQPLYLITIPKTG